MTPDDKALFDRACEVVFHAQECPARQAADALCECDAVKFLSDLEARFDGECEAARLARIGLACRAVAEIVFVHMSDRERADRLSTALVNLVRTVEGRKVAL